MTTSSRWAQPVASLAVLVCCAGCPGAASQPAPRLVVDRPVRQVPLMLVGQEYEQEFVLRNAGTAALELRPGPPSCACAAFDLPQPQIPPGGSSTAVLRWTPESGEPQLDVAVPIETNDPDQPRLVLSTRGAVTDVVVKIPLIVWVAGEMEEGQPLKYEGHLASLTHEFEITGIDSTHPAARADHRRLSEKGADFVNFREVHQLTAIVDPEIPPGRFTETLTVRLRATNPTQPQPRPVEIEISGVRYGPFKIIGRNWVDEFQSLGLPEFPAAEGRTAELFLDVRTDFAPLAIEKAETDAEDVLVDVRPDERVKGQRRYVIAVQIKPGRPVVRRGKQSVNVLLKTNHPTAPEVRFRVQYVSS